MIIIFKQLHTRQFFVQGIIAYHRFVKPPSAGPCLGLPSTALHKLIVAHPSDLHPAHVCRNFEASLEEAESSVYCDERGRNNALDLPCVGLKTSQIEAWS